MIEHAPLDRACADVAAFELDVAALATLDRAAARAARARLVGRILPVGRALALAAASLTAADTREGRLDRSTYQGALAAYQGACAVLGLAPASFATERPTLRVPPQRPYPELLAEAAARAERAA